MSEMCSPWDCPCSAGPGRNRRLLSWLLPSSGPQSTADHQLSDPRPQICRVKSLSLYIRMQCRSLPLHKEGQPAELIDVMLPQVFGAAWGGQTKGNVSGV